jgi:hypothetical protein
MMRSEGLPLRDAAVMLMLVSEAMVVGIEKWVTGRGAEFSEDKAVVCGDKAVRGFRAGDADGDLKRPAPSSSSSSTETRGVW